MYVTCKDPILFTKQNAQHAKNFIHVQQHFLSSLATHFHFPFCEMLVFLYPMFCFNPIKNKPGF